MRAAEYWLDEYGIRTAWTTTKGAGVRIAVIDTGIGRVPELDSRGGRRARMSRVRGSSDGRTAVGAVDGNHGSWVASLAAARGTSPDTGMIGVAPEAELLSISVAFGSSASVPFAEQIAQAMHWAVDHGADVINLSLTTNTPDWDESWDDAFLYAFDHDVVVVVAAGNRGSGTTRVGAPATIPGVLTVAGVDPQGKASLEASTQGITIGVSAPSENLVGVSADGSLVLWDGTSGAAPIVAGIAALVRSAHPDLDAANVINRIIRTAHPAADETAVPDPLYGYGLVDAGAAVSASVPLVTANPMGSLEDWIRTYRRADAAPVPQPQAGPGEDRSAPSGGDGDAGGFPAAADREHPPVRHPSSVRGDRHRYTGSARYHRCCPTHPNGALFPHAEPLISEEFLSPCPAPRTALCPRSSSSVEATPASTPRGSSRSTSARARPRSWSSTRCPT